jgi:hypothetical protein
MACVKGTGCVTNPLDYVPFPCTKHGICQGGLVCEDHECVLPHEYSECIHDSSVYERLLGQTTREVLAAIPLTDCTLWDRKAGCPGTAAHPICLLQEGPCPSGYEYGLFGCEKLCTSNPSTCPKGSTCEVTNIDGITSSCL